MGRGCDKVQQVYEMSVAGYAFVVLPQGFLVHQPHPNFDYEGKVERGKAAKAYYERFHGSGKRKVPAAPEDGPRGGLFSCPVEKRRDGSLAWPGYEQLMDAKYGVKPTPTPEEVRTIRRAVHRGGGKSQLVPVKWKAFAWNVRT